MMTYLLMDNVHDCGIGIENFQPMLKKPVMTIIKGCEHIKVASFNNDEAVQEFIAMCNHVGVIK